MPHPAYQADVQRLRRVVARVVTQPGWEEFPSSPMLYQVMTETG